MAAKKAVKPGYQTSEFWVVAGTIAAMTFGIPVPPEMAAIVMGVLGSVYTGVRGWVKARG